MYSWLKSSRCWPIRWVGRERCPPGLSTHIQERSKAVFYTTHPIIHKLIHRACGFCGLDHQSELFMCSSVGGGKKEKKRKSLVGNDCGQNEARKVVWKRLQSSSWKKSRSDWWEQKYRGGITASVPVLLLLLLRVGGQVWSEQSVAVPDGREAVWHLLVTGSKRRIENIHLSGRICKAGSARVEEQDRTGAAVSLPLVAGGFKGQTCCRWAFILLLTSHDFCFRLVISGEGFIKQMFLLSSRQSGCI